MNEEKRSKFIEVTHAMSWRKMRLLALFLALSACKAAYRDPGEISEDGYYKREHSLVQPYHGECLPNRSSLATLNIPSYLKHAYLPNSTGNGMDVPFWTFGGSTVITSNYVRLTPDRQSKKGILWNTSVSQSVTSHMSRQRGSISWSLNILPLCTPWRHVAS